MGSNTNVVSDQNFSAEVLSSTLPVLIDFWAPWCGPCVAIAPLLDELAGEYKGRLKIVKMNVDENAHTPAQYGVRSIPNLVFIKNGEVVNNIVGAVPKNKLKDAIDKIV